jgi:integrase
MASLSHDSGGGRRIQFMGPDGRRKSVRLGPVPAKVAESVKTKIEYILAFRAAGVPLEGETAGWLGAIDDELHERIAATGIIGRRAAGQLGPFFRAWIEERADQNVYTRRNLRDGLNRLVGFFGDDADLRSITPERAAAFKSSLADVYASATIGRTVKRARQFFKQAVKRGVVKVNPFTDVTAPDVSNRSRIQFVDRGIIARVLAKCPTPYWRALIALSRFAGLRVPSEVVGLNWEDIDWKRKSITLFPEMHEGIKKRERTFPLFFDLRPYLEEIRGESGPVLVPALSHKTFRERMEGFIAEAGVTQWERLWHNLRASCETELLDRFPSHVVAEWMGHSEAISRKHYSAPNDSHFERAAAAQSAAQSGSELG